MTPHSASPADGQSSAHEDIPDTTQLAAPPSRSARITEHGIAAVAVVAIHLLVLIGLLHLPRSSQQPPSPPATLEVALIMDQPAHANPAHPPAPPAPPAPPEPAPQTRQAPAKPQVKPKTVQPAPAISPQTTAPAETLTATPITRTAAPSPSPAVQESATPAAASSSATHTPAPAPVIAPSYNADYLNNPKPGYPSISQRLGEEGRVMLRVLVAEDGTPSEIEQIQSSGSERLDNAAREAVKRWRFVPARQGERKIKAWVQVPIDFKL